MSKKLDDELAEALNLGAHTDAPPVEKSTTRSTPKAASSRASLGLLAVLLVMGGAIVALFMVGFKEAAVYALPVDQLMSQKDKLAGRKVRVEGELVKGTLVKRDDPCEYRFTVHGPQSEMPVSYAQCVIPDTFRDVPGVQVTVEGTLNQAGTFDATLVMAKCTSKYDPETHEIQGAEAATAPGPLSQK
ncbi:cytochrome c maturation protein CcmE [Chondromyces apiculatus]|uniref:Cytochrome c-type biogenesis protein CcmE, heme chaperone n=1 Tax=Chondromyces apiculatus DSM 436 TaxID=1192034 RepID=A0A017SZW5_9BACT|nr:cytochrome c maturation protein CcmE [Chondromyces apiculatus]EYF02514.1 Cytochrome c-type biogenesis protein CcmE, heme chaperone [Chondromyces apiculatus DSM 436]